MSLDVAVTSELLRRYSEINRQNEEQSKQSVRLTCEDYRTEWRDFKLIHSSYDSVVLADGNRTDEDTPAFSDWGLRAACSPPMYCVTCIMENGFLI